MYDNGIKLDYYNLILGKDTIEKVDETIGENNNIHIVLSIDDIYVQHLSSLMASILLNTNCKSNINFHILDGGISKKSKEKLLKLKYIKNFSIFFYDMARYDFSLFPLNRENISIATYYRLLIIDILPKEVDRIIYLDADMIVETDISKLWNVNLDNRLIASVKDEYSIKNSKRLRLSAIGKYFNAGVLLIDLNKLRKTNFFDECVKCYKENRKIIKLQDQDILNIIFDGKCKLLELNWNVNSRIYLGHYDKPSYSDTERYDAAHNPYIIHYTGKLKPWTKGCCHPLREEYFKYLKKTPFKSFCYKHSINKILSIINNFIYSKYDKDDKCIIVIFGIKITIKPIRIQLEKLNKKTEKIYYLNYKLYKELYKINNKNIKKNKSNSYNSEGNKNV